MRYRAVHQVASEAADVRPWSDGVASRRFFHSASAFIGLVAVLPYIGDPDIDQHVDGEVYLDFE